MFNPFSQKTRKNKRITLALTLLLISSLFIMGCSSEAESYPEPAAETQKPAETQTSEENSATTSLEPTEASDEDSTEFVDAGNMEIHFIDVGQGDAILVLSPSGQTMLIDAGPRSAGQKVVSYLKAAGVTTIHKVISTHPHEDHIGGMVDVMENFEVEEVYDSGHIHTTQTFERYLTTIDQKNIGFNLARTGDTIDFDQAMTVTVIAPNDVSDEINDSSVALKITYNDISFITTGDAETHTEQAILQSGIDLSAQIYKAGHHGSRTSSTSSFLDVVNPETVIVMVGQDNTYGHPHVETMNNFANRGMDVYRTDLQGDLVIESNGTSYVVSTAPAPLAVETSQPAPIPMTEKPSEETTVIEASSYIGNVNSKVFHNPTCKSLPAEHNQVHFSTRQEAVDTGHRPCGNCKP